MVRTTANNMKENAPPNWNLSTSSPPQQAKGRKWKRKQEDSLILSTLTDSINRAGSPFGAHMITELIPTTRNLLEQSLDYKKKAQGIATLLANTEIIPHNVRPDPKLTKLKKHADPMVMVTTTWLNLLGPTSKDLP